MLLLSMKSYKVRGSKQATEAKELHAVDRLMRVENWWFASNACVCMCVYVCVTIREAHLCMYACMFMCVLCTWAHYPWNSSAHIRMHLCVHVCVCTMHINNHTNHTIREIHGHMFICMHACMHALRQCAGKLHACVYADACASVSKCTCVLVCLVSARTMRMCNVPRENSSEYPTLCAPLRAYVCMCTCECVFSMRFCELHRLREL